MQKPSLSTKYITLALITIITLAVFYPVLSASLTSLDDAHLVMDLNDPSKTFSLKTLFLHHSIDRYYRPFLALTFIIDSKIWLTEPSGYHLTNYVLHTLNAFLLFLIGLKLFKGYPNSEHVAFVTTLLFSIHPLTCESVAWISGRSDILGTFFCLFTFYFYLSHFKGKSVLVILTVLLGLLSKENALAIIPVILIANIPLHYSKGEDLIHTAKSTIIWLIILCIPLTIYLYMRMDGLPQFDHGLKMAVSTNISEGNSLLDSLLLYVPATIAFYIKKLFLPFPLNFAIYQINVTFYSGLFIFIMILVSYFYIKKKYCVIIWLTLIIAAFSPAIFAATSKIAWTPFAERYLYLAVAVWALAMGRFIQYVVEAAPRSVNFLKPIVISILVVFSVTTFLRTLVWQNNLSLWADTYRKSPDFGKVLYKYGEALGNSKGLPYFKKAVETTRDEEWKDFSLLALARQAEKDKKYLEARKYINRAIQIRAIPENYYTAASILRNMPESKEKGREPNIEKCIDYYQKAYDQRHDPFALFQIGVLQTRLKNYHEAQITFNKITAGFPSSRYAGYAGTRLKHIRKRLQSDQ